MIIVLTGLTIAERRKTACYWRPALINKIARYIAGRMMITAAMEISAVLSADVFRRHPTSGATANPRALGQRRAVANHW